MSDYESDYGDSDYDESDEDESPKTGNAIKYTHDGLNESDYRRSDVAHENLIRAECCQNYFKVDAYVHQRQYKLGIQGINTCIHCHISFNLHKFAECKDLTQTEEDCLQHYIEKFTDEHGSDICTRTKNYGKCLLCESKIGILPKICRKHDSTVEVIESDLNSVITTDILMINRTNGSDYVLVL